MSHIGSSGVANYSPTYPGNSLRVNANANDGWGNAVGGQSVIVDGDTPISQYFMLLESGDYILLQNDDKILLEIS